MDTTSTNFVAPCDEPVSTPRLCGEPPSRYDGMMAMRWWERLEHEARQQGMPLSRLETLAFGADRSRLRSLFHRARKGQEPRTPKQADVTALAGALGVGETWLMTGEGIKRPGDESDPTARLDEEEVAKRRAFAMRIKGVRERRHLSVEECCAGLVISPARWRLIEDGLAALTLTELQVIAERLRQSLDFLVSGHFVESLDVRHFGEPATMHDLAPRWPAPPRNE